MKPAHFSGSLPDQKITGVTRWSSPSNIALTKYWGKHGDQLPRNPSVSFTLSEARTETEVRIHSSDDHQDLQLDFLFEGQKNESFALRISDFLLRHEDKMPYIRHFNWHISSKNTFPHSSGIASSASAMSCLIMNIIDIERQYLQHDLSDDEAVQRASYLSRLASGSASRSVYPMAAVWGKCDGITDSHDEYAIPVGPLLHEIFQNYHDDILIVSADEKSVSSSAGHKLMENNPYSHVRFEQAARNTATMMSILRQGELMDFIELIELEALTLHALMMTSTPSYILMHANTLKVIESIRRFRKEKDIPIGFTLDAGPNVHILYPDRYEMECQNFISDRLMQYSTGTLIRDRVGQGPEKLL